MCFRVDLDLDFLPLLPANDDVDALPANKRPYAGGQVTTAALFDANNTQLCKLMLTLTFPGDILGATTDFLRNNAQVAADVALGCHHGAEDDGANNSLWHQSVSHRCVIISTSGTHKTYHHPRESAVNNMLQSPGTLAAAPVASHDLHVRCNVNGQWQPAAGQPVSGCLHDHLNFTQILIFCLRVNLTLIDHEQYNEYSIQLQ